MRAGQWVEITKYDGPIRNLNAVGAVVKIVGVDKTNAGWLATSLRVRGDYGVTGPLIVKHDEVKAIDLDARDANGIRINVGDDVAWSAYGGHLNQGKVIDIIPKEVNRYDYQTKKSTRRIEFSLKVENGKSSRSFSNYSSPYVSETARRVTYEAPSMRRVDGMHRVLVVKQKDPCENAPKPSPVWPDGGVMPSWPTQPLMNPPATWPGNGIRVTSDVANAATNPDGTLTVKS